MSESTIHAFWGGRPLGELEWLAMRSFLFHKHRFVLWTYDRTLTVPDGVEIADAGTLVEPEVFAKWNTLVTHPHKMQTFANWLRYLLIFSHGGWWVDMDIVCLKPLSFDQEYVFTSVSDIPLRQELYPIRNALGSYGNICNGFFKAPKASPFLAEIIHEIEPRAMVAAPPDVYGMWGSVLFSRMIVKWDLLRFWKPSLIGSSFSKASAQFTDPLLEIPTDAWVLHFYNYLGRSSTHPESLYARIRDRFL